MSFVTLKKRGKLPADREGFEPSVLLLAHTLSKRAHSTTLTPALSGRARTLGAARALGNPIFSEKFRRKGNPLQVLHFRSPSSYHEAFFVHAVAVRELQALGCGGATD